MSDWATVIVAGITAASGLGGIFIGGIISKHAEANAVKRTAYAAYLTAVGVIISNRKQYGSIRKDEWHNLRATRYAAELVGSVEVAKLARELSKDAGEAQPGQDEAQPGQDEAQPGQDEAQPAAKTDFTELLRELIQAMRRDAPNG
jgi:hypothetical protein